jgi:vacuolar-type H+-ATPase subunit E/Vma4
MSLESILERINAEGLAQKEKIIQAAQKEAEDLIYKGRLEAERLDREIVKREKAIVEKQKQGRIVNARLKAKNDLLSCKQELIDIVFEKAKEHIGKNRFKKQLISHEKVSEVSEDTPYYLDKIRHDYESEIAKILFD